MWPNPTPRTMIWTCLSLHHLKKLPHKFLVKWFLRRFYFFLFVILCKKKKKKVPYCCQTISPGIMIWTNLGSTSPEDTFKQVSAFLTKWFLGEEPFLLLPYPRVSQFEQTWNFTTWGCILKSFSLTGQMV